MTGPAVEERIRAYRYALDPNPRTARGAHPSHRRRPLGFQPRPRRRGTRRLRIDTELAELAEARTSYFALLTHLQDNKYFYHRAIWSRYDYAWIAERIWGLGLPPALFEPRFAAFDGEYGAIRLADLTLAERHGLSTKNLRTWMSDVDGLEITEPARVVTIPAAGVAVEPLLGACAGGDDFVAGHRALDLERAAAETRRLQAVAERQARQEVGAAQYRPQQ